MARFHDKSILVTGAGSGIGRATARRFAAEGGRVIVSDLTDGADETARLIHGEGGDAEAFRGDAGADADVRAMIDRAIARHGGLDVIHANAGVSGGEASLFEQDAADWAEILRINLIGPFLAIKHGGMKIAERGGGAIVVTASVAGLRSGAGGPAYSASKAGAISLVQLAAQQLATTNVRVNAVCPGLIQTGMTQIAYDRADAAGKRDLIGRLNPLRRGGEVEEIAAAVTFLASDEASYVNGHALIVDGGLSSSHPVARQELGRTAF